MTIIAAKDGEMAADSVVSIGEIHAPVAFPKLLKLFDGRIVGAAGYAADCWAVMRWFADGEPEKRPLLIGEPEKNEVDVLLMRPDGSIWRSARFVDGFYPQPNGVSIGSAVGCVVTETAMRLGKSASEAVALAIEMVGGLGGTVQTERIKRRY